MLSLDNQSDWLFSYSKHVLTNQMRKQQSWFVTEGEVGGGGRGVILAESKAFPMTLYNLSKWSEMVKRDYWKSYLLSCLVENVANFLFSPISLSLLQLKNIQLEDGLVVVINKSGI